MREIRTLAVSILILATIFGAAACGYKIHVKTVVTPEPMATLAPGASVHVQRDDSPAFDPEMPNSAKVERLLTDRGYEITRAESADFLLFFDYEKEAMLGKKQVEPLSGGSTGIHSVRKEGPYVHRLTISVVEARPYLDQKETKVVWAGGAMTDLVNLHSPKTIDMLLVSVFSHFGKDTGETLTTRMQLNEAKAHALRFP